MGMKRQTLPTAAPLPRCADCGAGLAHEILTFLACGPEGRAELCVNCTRRSLRRLEQSDRQAVAILEGAWRLPSGGAG